MADHRLLEALTRYDPAEIERIFGDEYALDPPRSNGRTRALKTGCHCCGIVFTQSGWRFQNRFPHCALFAANWARCAGFCA